MNTLENKIQSDLMTAMKNKDTVKTTVLRNIKKAIMEVKTAEANAIKDPTDADIIKIMQKMAKELDKAIVMFVENKRTDLADSYKAEVDVLTTYLPKSLSEAEIEAIVEKTITDFNASTMKDMGKVMGYINKTYAGQVDGSIVSKIVKAKLS